VCFLVAVKSMTLLYLCTELSEVFVYFIEDLIS